MPLLIDLLRHGRSEPQHREGDRARRLTREGERAIAALGARLKSDGWHPDRVFSSPYVRARDTASIVLREAGLSTLAVEALRELEAEVEPEELLSALETLRVTNGHVLLVGHQPQLGRLAGYLTRSELGLTTGQLLRIDLPDRIGPGAGSLVIDIRPTE